MAYEYDLIVIGGGSAGLSLASGAAQLGIKTLIISKEMLGGDCLHYGCVPSKALLKSAKAAHYFSHAEKYGLINTVPNMNWPDVTKRIGSIQAQIQEHDHPNRFRKLGCEVLFGTATFINAHEINIELTPHLRTYQPISVAGKERLSVTGRRISIATGSRPQVPNIEGLADSGFITNERIFTLSKQPQTLAIIGGGVIAAEMAQAFSRLGTKVYIVEKHEKFFGRFDPDIAQVIKQRFKSEGIEIYTNTGLVKAEKDGQIKRLVVEKDGQQYKLEINEILVATGRAPNTELNLEAAGVAYTEKGITVDKKLRTNKKHITAIGDVNGQMLFTHAANYEAGVVLTNELIRLPFVKAKADYSQIGWTIYTDPEIASIGIDEATAKKKEIKHEVIKFDLAKNDRAISESSTEGLVKIIINKKKQVIGCQIVAPRAGEMIREWQLVISQKIKLSKVARSTFIYPTYGEASKWAAGSYFSPKLFSPKMKRLLKIMHRYRG